jgi:glycerate 2-kinase
MLPPILRRDLAEAVLAEVVAACDPARRVRDALASPAIAPRLAGRRPLAFAVGKAALAMARGAGPVTDGIAIVPAGGAGSLPAGWQLREASHPVPDARSLAAGAALLALVGRAAPEDAVLALLSGGASALAELPAATGAERVATAADATSAAFAELVATVRQVMAAGAPIDEINAVRGALSAIKAGRLALASTAPVITLAVSDVIGDPLAVIGSGPTIGPWLAHPGTEVDDGSVAIWRRARAVLDRLGIAVPAILAREPPAHRVVRSDHAEVIAPMASAVRAAIAALRARGVAARLIESPVSADVEDVAQQLVAEIGATSGGTTEGGPIVAWGEPTVRVPSKSGVGGRSQQLALILARHVRGSERVALVVGTDGVDGPPPPDRPSPAGAWVDGGTWDAIAAAGIDPAAALAACDAGTALAAVGALVVTGPTGINHADLILVG